MPTDHPQPPLPAFGPVVVKLGGTAVEAPHQTPDLWHALHNLHRTERAAGRPGLVLVHGGGKAADELLATLGLPTVRKSGLRVTPPDQLNHIAAVLAGRVNKSIVAALHTAGQHAVGLCPGECSTATVQPLTIPDADLGLVGEIIAGDPALINTLLGADIVPVFSPIAINPGAPEPFLNVNADDVAASVSAIVRARTLILLTDTPGVRDARSRTIPYASAEEIEELIATGTIHSGMVPKVRAALRAASLARCDTVIASWQHPETLAAVCEGLPIGTRITSAHTPAQA